MVKEKQYVDATRVGFLAKIKELEKSILQTGEELKQTIDRHVSELLERLDVVKSESEKEMNSRLESLDVKLVAIESFINYAEEVKDKGTPCDISRVGSDLNTRANELKKIPSTISQYRPPEISFTHAVEVLL